MFRLFDTRPPIAPGASAWIERIFGWAVARLDGAAFRDEARLVLPTNDHFPGRESSVDGIARLIFERVRDYAGLGHWRCTLVAADHCAASPPPLPRTGPVVRGRRAGEADADACLIAFDPAMVGNPEALIASLAQQFAHALLLRAPEPPPCPPEQWPQAAEVVAVFLGFGLMLANSAYRFRGGGCGACGSAVDRAVFLGEDEVTYALALFCALQGLDARTVVPHLKKSLRGHFRRCLRAVGDAASTRPLLEAAG